MKNNLFATFLMLTVLTYAFNLQAEAASEKKARIAQEKKDKATAKAKRKAEYQKKEKIRIAQKKARQKAAAQEENSVFEKSKKWDDYVPARFMNESEKSFSTNKSDSITQINDSYTF